MKKCFFENKLSELFRIFAPKNKMEPLFQDI